jgi:hypothetical protein
LWSNFLTSMGEIIIDRNNSIYAAKTEVQ